MCGICGVVNWEGSDVDAVLAMSSAMVHRGPNAHGLAIRTPAVLAHRRLSIIDLTDDANQPMADQSGRYWITFNGEIYNYRIIRAELESSGLRFRTQSDTEVLLYAYIIWGVECLQHLNGMFAFAVWDDLEKRLFLARDRLGEKPLYYSRLPGGGLVFASELKALRLHPMVSRRINPRAISQFLSLNYVLTDECIIDGVQKLPPAHFLIAEAGKNNAPQCYWDLAVYFRTKRNFGSDEEATAELNALIKDAVDMRLVSDVPLGAFLSGGLDSSTIVAAMSRLRPPGQNLTFSSGFSEESFSELPKARFVAQYLGVHHYDQIVDGNTATALQAIVRYADEPFADTSIIPTFFLSRFAAKHVTVCLTGDGGDELFGGYETYIADKIHGPLHRLPGPMIEMLNLLAHALVPNSFDKVSLDYKLKKLLSGARLEQDCAHYHWRTIFSQAEKRELIRAEHHDDMLGVDPCLSFLTHARKLADADFLDRAMYTDIKTWLVDDVLHKVDRASMAHSLETRAPFLDHKLVEFAASLPVHLKVHGLQKKYLLKNSQRQVLPAHIIDAKKQGFNAPVSHWLNSALEKTTMRVMREGPLLDWLKRDTMTKLWEDHKHRRQDNGLKLFGILCLGLWLEN
ncbi:asparagine synthase (glutamine-hydrolyzing) [Nitrospira sp. Nam74]